MAHELKPRVPYESTFGLLDIRLGRVLSVDLASGRRVSYKLIVDFGKFGVRTSVARLTQHKPEELVGQLVFGVLNFEPREVCGIASDFLTLGVQFPGADSGEATPVTPLNSVAKIGSKLF